MSKSYWQKMSVRTERDQIAIKSWFRSLCDGYTVESAEVLCDAVTDREKKLRAVMVDADGTKRIATLSRNKREDVINLKRVRPRRKVSMQPGNRRAAKRSLGIPPPKPTRERDDERAL